MTQFLKEMVPGSITTFEALAVWADEVLSYLYAEKTSVESVDGNGEPVDTRCIQSGTIFITASDPAGWRFVSRKSLSIKPEFHTGSATWNNVNSLGDKTCPTSMRAA